MDSIRPAYRGDAELSRLLDAAGVRLSPAEVRDLLAGVGAAPAGERPDRWLALFGAALPSDLVDQLKALKDSLPVPNDPEAGDHAARLKALRAELHRRGLDGFVIPRGDEHQGEYVPSRAQRLAWVSGFTGSAGMVVVLKDRAAIFVDGRYTLQVRQETSGDLFEYRHLVDEFHGDWAAGHLKAGQKLGFDPWLHTVGWVERMRNSLARSGAELIAVDDNPVDAVWSGQPPRPLGLVSPHPETFAGRSSAEKRADIAAELRRQGNAAAVLTQPDSIAWLLNVRGSDVPCTPLPLSFAVARDTGEVDWFVDRRKLAPGMEAHVGNQVAIRPPEELGGVLDQLGAAKAKVSVDPNWAAVWVFDRLHTAGARIDREADPCLLPKAGKNAVEVAGVRAAHLRDGAAMARFLAWIDREGPTGRLTEIEAADRLLAFRREGEHFRDQSFETISGSGPNGAIVHYRASPKTNRAIEPGTLYLVDSGAQYLDGTTDITRTVAIGTPTAEMKRHFTLVLKGHIAIATVRFPKGTTGSQLDVLGRHALWQEGLDYDHGTGHGVGAFLSVHEGPQRIAKVPNATALQPGMILSNEPGYYRTGAYGIRIENLILVQPVEGIAGAERPMFGFETLTFCPIDIRLVEPGMLTQGERAWLNAYHADVRGKLLPRLDTETAAWLEGATAPV